MLQIIMVCTTRTASSMTWNRMAPQIAENAKPATLDIAAAANTAAEICSKLRPRIQLGDDQTIASHGEESSAPDKPIIRQDAHGPG